MEHSKSEAAAEAALVPETVTACRRRAILQQSSAVQLAHRGARIIDGEAGKQAEGYAEPLIDVRRCAAR